MKKQELFKKYSINESHSEWNDKIDNWVSVEIYRIMHDGNLPPADDVSILWVLDFMDKFKSDTLFKVKLMKRDDFGSLYLTSKRLIFSLTDQILNDLKNKN